MLKFLFIRNKLKNFCKLILNLFGYKIIKIRTIDHQDPDGITKFIINKKNPCIFDVGANKGQSIERYLKNYNPTIHCFEPLTDEINFLKRKFLGKKIFFNNLAVGEKSQYKTFNIFAKSTQSSFYEPIKNTTWIKKMSEIENIDRKKYIIKKILTKVTTLDEYCLKNNIQNIDILKIDTQGYEDKVLEGAKNLIMKNKIKLIELELIFSENYKKSLQIYDVEKFLIKNNYKLFSISNGGSLMSDFIFAADFIYLSSDTYKIFKLNSPYFNN